MGKLPHFLSNFWVNLGDNQDTLAAAGLTLLAAVLIFFCYNFFLKQSTKGRKLSSPPGPRGLPLLGNLLSLKPELHTYFAELAQTYGPIYKLQFGNKVGIVVSSPSLAKEVLKDYDTTFANRDVPAVAKALGYGAKDIAWTPLGAEWRMLRKVCVREMLGNSSLESVSSFRKSEVQGMVRRIYSKIGAPINVGEELFLTAMNIITSMLWGGTLIRGERTNIGAEFRQVVTAIVDLLGKPNISDFYPALERLDLQGFQKKIKAAGDRFDKIFDAIIEQRLKMKEREIKQSKDFLQLLLQLEEQKDAKMPLTMVHVKALLMDMVTAGTDTTSNSVEWAMVELMNKPGTMKKVQEELDRVVGRDNLVEESHLPELNYLHLVMKEVLRLHPALPLLIPHCPSSSCSVGGYMVDKGSRVFVNVWAIHRDPTIWADPSEFDPERFLEGKWDYTGSDFKYIPFGSGRRICAGIVMAERIFLYELATLLHSFDWSLKEGEMMDLEEKFGIVLKKAKPLVAVPTARLSNPALYM